MRIAIIGGGISGNLTARLLCEEHEVHLFEANDYAGGHTNTVEISAFGQTYRVDTGFMVFNERTYPNFCRMLRLFGVESRPSDMSLSVMCRESGFEYQGSSLNGLFAQRKNLVSAGFYRMLWDILRFNRVSIQSLEAGELNDGMTVGEFLRRKGFRDDFVWRYLVPMSAAIWSAPPGQVLEFPAQFMIGFFRNHGLLQLWGRPQWRTITGGAQKYVRPLLSRLGKRLNLSCRVTRVTRSSDQVLVETERGAAGAFEHVVFASHADQTLKILADATPAEREVLGSFPYQTNDVVLHLDTSVLPKSRRAWASWNAAVSRRSETAATVTYDLSRLQGHDSPSPILLTLNCRDRIDPTRVLERMTYEHPAYSRESARAQLRHAAISGVGRTHFCGAYWGYGFHEDGVKSALAVAAHFGKSFDTCTAAST
jgi:predicted NAD/FAD-binding protein